MLNDDSCEAFFLKAGMRELRLHSEEQFDSVLRETFQLSYDQLREARKRGEGSLQILDFFLQGNFTRDDYEQVRRRYNSERNLSVRQQYRLNLLVRSGYPDALEAYRTCVADRGQLGITSELIFSDDDTGSLVIQYKRTRATDSRHIRIGRAEAFGGVELTQPMVLRTAAKLEEFTSHLQSFTRSRTRDGGIVIGIEGRPQIVVHIERVEDPVTKIPIRLPGIALPEHKPKHIRGDRDFDGDVDILIETWLEISDDRKRLIARVRMRAVEEGGDRTTADSVSPPSGGFVLYTTADNETIEKIESPKSESLSFTDTDHDRDVFDRDEWERTLEQLRKLWGKNFKGGYRYSKDRIVERYSIVGDTDGDEAGTRTRVQVDLRPVEILVARRAT